MVLERRPRWINILSVGRAREPRKGYNPSLENLTLTIFGGNLLIIEITRSVESLFFFQRGKLLILTVWNFSYDGVD